MRITDRIEVAAHTHEYVRTIPPQVEEYYRNHACCKGCQQRIYDMKFLTRGIHLYHPSCARRADTTAARSAALPAATNAAPRVIARLEGVATSFDPAGCEIFDKDGLGSHERFAPDCFDESIRAGGQQLWINHEKTQALRGAFVSIRNDAMRLLWVFHLYDGARERDALSRIESGAIGRCSIGYIPREQRRVNWTAEHLRADLNEISILDNRRPAWYGTWCRAHRVA